MFKDNNNFTLQKLQAITEKLTVIRLTISFPVSSSVSSSKIYSLPESAKNNQKFDLTQLLSQKRLITSFCSIK